MFKLSHECDWIFCYKYFNRLLINLIIVGIIQIFKNFAPFNIVWVINIVKDYDLHYNNYI